MYFEDMSNYCFYLKKPLSRVFNVGWLEAGGEYPKGQVDSAIFKKLAEIITATENIDAHVNWARSLDACALSGCENLSVTFANRSVCLGGSEIWVPAVDGDKYFAAPTLIYHYIQQHEYLPPIEFLEAVRSFDMYEPYRAQDVYLELIKGHF